MATAQAQLQEAAQDACDLVTTLQIWQRPQDTHSEFGMTHLRWCMQGSLLHNVHIACLHECLIITRLIDTAPQMRWDSSMLHMCMST